MNIDKNTKKPAGYWFIAGILTIGITVVVFYNIYTYVVKKAENFFYRQLRQETIEIKDYIKENVWR